MFETVPSLHSFTDVCAQVQHTLMEMSHQQPGKSVFILYSIDEQLRLQVSLAGSRWFQLEVNYWQASVPRPGKCFAIPLSLTQERLCHHLHWHGCADVNNPDSLRTLSAPHTSSYFSLLSSKSCDCLPGRYLLYVVKL